MTKTRMNPNIGPPDNFKILKFFPQIESYSRANNINKYNLGKTDFAKIDALIRVLEQKFSGHYIANSPNDEARLNGEESGQKQNGNHRKFTPMEPAKGGVQKLAGPSWGNPSAPCVRNICLEKGGCPP